jgi:PAS domain S-box-containing protein
MVGFGMSPGKEMNELTALREKLDELEAELQRQVRRQQMSEARFYLLADAAPLMIWMAGSDGLCTYFNRAWLEFRGRDLEQEAGNGWAEGLHADDRSFCMDTYLTAFEAREPFRIQYRLQRASGDYRWLEDTGMPRFDEEGSFAGFIGSATDINDRKRGIFTPDEESMKMVFALTERERQVLVLIADGKSTKEAAVRLGISYKTADSHRSRILEKLGVHETASMVRYAIRAGLITP